MVASKKLISISIPISILFLGAYLFIFNHRSSSSFDNSYINYSVDLISPYESNTERIDAPFAGMNAPASDDSNTTSPNATSAFPRIDASASTSNNSNTKSSNVTTAVAVAVTVTFAGIGATNVTLSHTIGDPMTCKEVIYTGHTKDPFEAIGEPGRRRLRSEGTVQWSWKGNGHIVRNSPAFQDTCLVFFKIPGTLRDASGTKMHPVWGRLPAAALIMSTFPEADILLYMDSDALLTYAKKNITTMYKELAFDGYGEDATFQHLKPGLIVSKPNKGWQCMECERFEVGHGCFNSGALLWNRTNAEPVLRAWWASRNDGKSKNFKNPLTPDDGIGMGGWNKGGIDEHMGEQNRLMYIFATNPRVRELVWPVPRIKSKSGKGTVNSTSCAKGIYTPCLQKPMQGKKMNWNQTKPPSCFISHYSNTKDMAAEHAKVMMEYGKSSKG